MILLILTITLSISTINCGQMKAPVELSFGEFEGYVEHAKTNNKVFDLLHEDFKYEYSTYTSYTIEEFQEEVNEMKNIDERNFLLAIKLRGNGRTIHTLIDDSSWSYTNHTTLLATYVRNSRHIEQYDILYIKISQTKKIDTIKLAAALTAAGLIITAGPFGMALVGQTATAAAATATGAKIAAIATAAFSGTKVAAVATTVLGGTKTAVAAASAVCGTKTALAATAAVTAGKIIHEASDMYDVAIGYGIYQMVQKKIFHIDNGQIYLKLS
ncbi:unnamed protein product [Adineta ricciae]|uniref:Uncharacterized protein n=1 Tax=Adineta ricciae TaxID=249248 RepID=A0A814KX19_ADIRI|nr:unnamed protein product [Adineta ricciae]CAF1197773.1 unnamed protein product [Adineta ricciae]